MAFFTASTSIAAGSSLNPLEVTGTNWKYNRLPYDATVEIMHNATATGIVCIITSGSDEIMQESPISAGGTAAVLPARLSTEPVTFTGKAGDVIQPRYRNTSGGAITLNFTIEITRRVGA